MLGEGEGGGRERVAEGERGGRRLRRRKEEEGGRGERGIEPPEVRGTGKQRWGPPSSRTFFFFFPFPLERLSRSLIWCFNIKLVVYEKKKVQDVFETSLEEEEG